MGWLSKIIINEIEMNIKDAVARSATETNAANITSNTNDINRIWNKNTHITNYYVAPNGNDNNTGTDSEHPLATIDAALGRGLYYSSMMNNCFNIHMASGDYYQTIRFGNFDVGRRINLWIDG